MPIETIRESGQPFAIQKVTEALVVEEVVAAQRTLYLDENHDPARPVLWDSRDVDVKSGFEDILRMVEESTGLWSKMSGGRTAILVNDTKNAPLARLYKKLAEAMPRELGVFTSYEEAVRWLTRGHSTASKAS